jgi:hypothetical protein
MPWASDPRTDPLFLHQALDTLVALDAQAVPVSQALKIEYLALMHSLDDPVNLMLKSGGLDGVYFHLENMKGWQQAYWFLKREPERARRLVRLMFANRLAQCDKPTVERPETIGNDPNSSIWSLYVADPTAPYAARALTPKQIFAWLGSSSLAQRSIPPFNEVEPKPESEWNLRASAIVRIAEALYERENGKPPASADMLVGRYLKKLPRGYEEPEDVPKGEPPADR